MDSNGYLKEKQGLAADALEERRIDEAVSHLSGLSPSDFHDEDAASRDIDTMHDEGAPHERRLKAVRALIQARPKGWRGPGS